MGIIIKTTASHIKRAPFQALAAIATLTITFFVATCLGVLVYSSNQILKYFETRPQIIAFLKDGSKPEQISSLQEHLYGDSRVKDVKYVSKEEALSIYKQATSDNPLLSELVSPSVFPASLEFSVVDLSLVQDVIAQIKKEEIVQQVGFTASLGGEATFGEVVLRLQKISSYIRTGVFGVMAVLVGTSFLILLVILGMRMTARKDEIEILRLIGATPGFIRSPLVFEALVYAWTGVLLGWSLSLLLFLYSSPNVVAFFGAVSVLPKDTLSFLTFFGIILGVELAFGTLLATMGSLLAISRARKN